MVKIIPKKPSNRRESPGVQFNRIKIDRGDDGGAFLGAFPL